MTGGDMVNTHRCGAVTFAAVVTQGTNTPICTDSNAYNYNDGTGVDTPSVCQNERNCSTDVLREMIDATDQGLSTGNPGDMDATWSTNPTTKVTTTTCITGWEPTAGTADYFCSHVLYTDDAGYLLDETGARLTQASASIGTWPRSMPMIVPAQCGGLANRSLASRGTSPRPPPEGLTDLLVRRIRRHLPDPVRKIQATAARCTVTGSSQDPEWISDLRAHGVLGGLVANAARYRTGRHGLVSSAPMRMALLAQMTTLWGNRQAHSSRRRLHIASGSGPDPSPSALFGSGVVEHWPGRARLRQ